MASPDEGFLKLVAPHEAALRLHCYRMLGSAHDSDDVLQETLVRAWRARASLSDQGAVRPWLYRIATNACLDELKNRKQRPLPTLVAPETTNALADPLPPTPEIEWLEPCPSPWLDAATSDPGAVYEIRESVALAFVAALQCLSAEQRAVLLLRDVLGLPAEETASTLAMSVSAANSALHRARTAVRERVGGREDEIAIQAGSETSPELLAKYIRAWEQLDLTALVALLHEDITLSMPPSATWLRGKTNAALFLQNRPFRILAQSTLQLVPMDANGQPAVAFYVGGVLHGVQVLKLAHGSISEVHHFMSEQSFAALGLPAQIALDSTTSRVEPRTDGDARAVADLRVGRISASVSIRAPRERVFAALASEEIKEWWVRPGVFDTREWHGEPIVGGRFQAAGQGRGQRYVIEGEFLEVDWPRVLVHSWRRLEAAGPTTTVRYELEPTPEGFTRLSLLHEGFTAPEVCESTAIGWETSLARLAELFTDT